MVNNTQNPKIFGAITHPSGFEAKPRAIPEKDFDEKLCAEVDNKILDVQKTLVEIAAKGGLRRDEFVGLNDRIQAFDTYRAIVRGDGFQPDERNGLSDRLQDLSKAIKGSETIDWSTLPSTDNSAAFGWLFDDLTAGGLQPEEAVEELHWRAHKNYGAAIGDRPGPVYADERAKLRASVSRGIDPNKVSAKIKPASNGSYKPGTLELVGKAIEIFPTLDVNGDKVMDRGEARKILTNYQQLGLTSAEAAALYSKQEILGGAPDSDSPLFEKVTLQDLNGLLEAAKAAPQVEKKKDEILTALGQELSNHQSRAAVPETPLYLSPDGPNPLKVAQGTEGSCWMLSTLPTFTKQELQSMVMDTGQGSYRMTMADGSTEEVAPLNEAERRVYSRGDGSWSGLMEKGLSQHLERSGQDLNYGWARNALKILANSTVVDHSLVATPAEGATDLRDRAEIAKLLDTTMKAGGAVFAHAVIAEYDKDYSLMSSGAHLYTVTGFQSEPPTVQLRNPWGWDKADTKDGLNDGNFAMTLTEFASNYSHVNTEKLASEAPAGKTA